MSATPCYCKDGVRGHGCEDYHPGQPSEAQREAKEIIKWFLHGEKCIKHEIGVDSFEKYGEAIQECIKDCLKNKIAAALQAREQEIGRLREELDDWKEGYAKTINEPCAADQKHCTCVPDLKREIQKWRLAAATVSVAPAPTDVSTPEKFQSAQATHISPLLERRRLEREVIEAARKLLGPGSVIPLNSIKDTRPISDLADALTTLDAQGKEKAQ